MQSSIYNKNVPKVAAVVVVVIIAVLGFLLRLYELEDTK
jgi:hypothetical protein